MAKYWPEIRRESRAVLQRSTIHGLTHVYKARSQPTRFFWLVLLLVGAAGFAANLIFIVERYYTNPVLTTYIPNYDEFIWPDIVFCNPTAPIPFSHYPHLHDKWKALLANASASYGNLTTYGDDIPGLIYALSTMSPYEYYMHKVPTLLQQWGIDVGSDKIDRSIEFQNNMFTFNNTYPFILFQMHLRYPFICHTFQLSRLAQLPHHKDTPRNTRQLSFFVDTDFNSYNMFNSDYIMRGVFMHFTLPNWLPQDDGYMILPAYNNMVKVKMTRTKYLLGKRHCRTSHYEVGIYSPLLTGEYRIYNGTKSDCKRYHSQKVYYENCGCYNPFLPLYIMPHRQLSMPPNTCYNMTLYNDTQIRANYRCLQEIGKQYEEGDEFSELVEEHCGEYIHPECESLSYTINMKADMWVEVWTGEVNERRREFMENMIPYVFPTNSKNRTREDIKRNIAIINMKRHSAFGDLVKEENEYPMSELISDIGGLMGLWMGLSVIGLFELVELFCKIVNLCFKICLTSKDQSDEELSSDVKETRPKRSGGHRHTLPTSHDNQRYVHPSRMIINDQATTDLSNDDEQDRSVDIEYKPTKLLRTMPKKRQPNNVPTSTHACPNGTTAGTDTGYVEFLYAL